ncbi:hypothetical protein ALMP_25150 [Streptomyces sp. A012304]|nr:hypothetical protein ALMP_25150 [Streptomyces sp. A012304]
MPLPDGPYSTASRWPHQPLQFLDHPVPAEEQVPFVRFEAGKSPVRRRRARLLRAQRLHNCCVRFLPPRLPRRDITTAGPHIRLNDLPRRQPLPGCRP